MLDDAKLIHDRDTFDALGLAEKQWQQLSHEYTFQLQPGDFQNIVLAGMGGSALAAELSRTWPGWKVPFNICRDYVLPTFVNERSLVIISSYSGNTEEAISCLEDAETRGCTIVIMASGGKLVSIAQQKNLPLADLPKIDRPRYGVLYGLKALTTIGEQTGLLHEVEAGKALIQSEPVLREALQSWRADVPVTENLAKQLALELVGRSVIVYAGPKLYPAAFKWKIGLNENAKNLAWCYAFSEFSHNEFPGWTSHPVEKPFAVVYLLSQLEHPRIQKRFELTERLLSGRWPSPIHVDVVGESILDQLLWAVGLGDMVGIYLAILNGVDPIDPPGKDIIETFKKQLG